MSEFKFGDKVRVSAGYAEHDDDGLTGQVGTVVRVAGEVSWPVEVGFPSVLPDLCYFWPEELELIPEETEGE